MFKSVDGELYYNRAGITVLSIQILITLRCFFKDPFCRVAHTFCPRLSEHMI